MRQLVENHQAPPFHFQPIGSHHLPPPMRSVQLLHSSLLARAFFSTYRALLRGAIRNGGVELMNGLRWTTFTWGLVVFVALLPVGLLGVYAFRITSQSLRDSVQANNLSAATITADSVSQSFEHSLNLARTIAASPDVIAAVQDRDEEGVRARLQTLVESYPRIDRAFVTDPTGLLWSDYPRAPESLGQNFSHRDWYRGFDETGVCQPGVQRAEIHPHPAACHHPDRSDDGG